MMMNNENAGQNAAQEIVIDWRSFLTWMTTAILIYGLLSGLAIWLLPFGAFTQYSIIIHSIIGLLSCAPVCWLVYLHWRRRNLSLPPPVRIVAYGATLLLALCLLTGVVVTLQAAFGTWVMPALRIAHLGTGLLLGLAVLTHLVPIFLRYRNVAPTPRRPARHRFAAVGLAGIVALFGATYLLVLSSTAPQAFQPFADDYEWHFGDDRPFWPSRAALSNPPWQTQLSDALDDTLDHAQLTALDAALADWSAADGGPISALRAAMESIDLRSDTRQRALQILDGAAADLKDSGAIKAETLTGSAACGSSGCHESIYNEWLPSAHGFSATDILFRRVQNVLADSEGAAHTRLCAGCHDPVALLSGARDGKPIDDPTLLTYEGNSCLVCHSTVSTNVAGDGGYTLQIPDRYLFEQGESDVARMLHHFLIRSYPYRHVDTYQRPLYQTSEFCAACHNQTASRGVSTTAGLAEEENEYESWRNGRWYHEENEQLRIECRECHMPLVASDDPASGDGHDSYRHSNDGKHRSHRMLGSNMYIPVAQDLIGGQEQADLTVAWLRGEIEIPEIENKWVTGPVVDIEIVAPDEIDPGELVNLKLHLHNNKTGHEFPGGLLDVLESWVELTVEDNLGNVLMQLGDETTVSPSLDAPVIYKADWYDRQGLPIERHNLWEVVGESYRRTLASGEDDVIDVPFRCPGIARPRLSESASEEGPGERKSEVVFSIGSSAVTELRVTAKLLFRKANPEFLANIYDLEPVLEAPVIELNRAAHTIKVRHP